MWLSAFCSTNMCHGPAMSNSTLSDLLRLTNKPVLTTIHCFLYLVDDTMVYRHLTIVRRNLVLVETCQWMERPIVSSLLVFVASVFFVFMSQSKSANKRSLVESDFRSGMRNERWTKRLVNTFSTCVCDVIVT